MVRHVMAASLGLALLAVGVGYPVGADDAVRVAPEKADVALVVKLRVPRDEEYAKVFDILQKVKARGAKHVSLRVSKASEGASAEVVAQSKTPSKRVAAVVAELLDCGIKKISVEVKK